MKQKTLLVLSQVYVPDPASVGQHMHDAAAEVAKRGHRVVTLCSARGYDDPTWVYPARETRDGVDIQRMPLSSFGKKSIATRLLGQFLFLAQITVRGLFTKNLGAILVSTSPPMCSVAALVISWLRGVPITYWAMDLNPDQVVAMGIFKENSPPVKAFNVLNRLILGRAHSVVALDRFMAERLNKKREVAAKLAVFPPWPHDDHIDVVEHRDNEFRREHRLGGGEPGSKFVVMYSGNHSPANPLDTVLGAAKHLSEREDIVFMFIGGGQAKKDVEKAMADGAKNIVSLPYQPIDRLKYSLSAADIHVVSVGNEVVGIVHPCKVYGSMSVARPVLTFGPVPCHISDLVDAYGIGRHHAHGDVDGAVRSIEELASMRAEERAEMGRRARRAVQERLGKHVLCARFADLVEAAMNRQAPPLYYEPRAAQGGGVRGTSAA